MIGRRRSTTQRRVSMCAPSLCRARGNPLRRSPSIPRPMMNSKAKRATGRLAQGRKRRPAVAGREERGAERLLLDLPAVLLMMMHRHVRPIVDLPLPSLPLQKKKIARSSYVAAAKKSFSPISAKFSSIDVRRYQKRLTKQAALNVLSSFHPPHTY